MLARCRQRLSVCLLSYTKTLYTKSIIILSDGRERHETNASISAMRHAGTIAFVGRRDGVPLYVPSKTDCYIQTTTQAVSKMPRHRILPDGFRTGPSGFTRTQYIRAVV